METEDKPAAEEVKTGPVYIKKMDRRVGWVRRLDAEDPETGKMIPVEPQPYVRISGSIYEGWTEQGDDDDFIRWIGVFHAESVKADGSLAENISRNLIFPDLENYIRPLFKKGTKESTIAGRTGEYYSLPDFHEVRFTFDIFLKQPETKNRRGYDFDIREVVKPHCVHVLHRETELHPFHIPTSADDTAEKKPAEAASQEKEGKQGKAHKKG